MRRGKWMLMAGLVAAAGSLGSAATAVPAALSYVGYVTYDTGAPYDGAVGVIVRAYDDAGAGGLLWTSALYPSAPIHDGFLSLVLSGGTPAIEVGLVGQPSVWLEFEVNGVTMSPRQQLMSVPFALEAGNADALGGFAAADYVTHTELDAALDGFTGSGGGSAFTPAATPPVTCGPSALGQAYLDTDTLELMVCDGAAYRSIATLGLGTPLHPAASCLAIHNAYAAAASGAYWIDPDGSGPVAARELYCDMQAGDAGWTQIVTYRSQYSDSGTPSGTGEANVANLKNPVPSGPAKVSDAFINAMNWSTYRVENYGDATRIIDSATSFNVQWGAYYNAVSGTTNGHNMQWCYKNTPAFGAQCYSIASTNTYSVSPHEAGNGGHWIHSPGSDAIGGFSCGFGGAAESNCTTSQYRARHWVR